ncbi:MAG: cupin domain-containing protein [Saprospiraceae bacterium]
MKKILLSIVTCCAILFSFPAISTAQDFCKTDPSFVKILNDTSYATALEVTFLPGKTTNMHTHPAFYAYVLEGGKLQVNYADGDTEIIELKAGDSLFGMPEKPHNTVNLGTKPVKMLMIEMKDHPYMASAKMK